MYAHTARRLHSLLSHRLTRPSALLRSTSTLTLRRPTAISLCSTSTTSLPHFPLVRTFARRSKAYDPDDDDDRDPPDDPYDEDDDIAGIGGTKAIAEEITEEEQKKAERGPSKAERLRLKEKEKRRQKLAMRERVDSKKEAKERMPRGGRRQRVMDTLDEFDGEVDVSIDIDDTLLTTTDGGDNTATTTRDRQMTESTLAERQRLKAEMMRRKFASMQGEGEEGEEEEEEEEGEGKGGEADKEKQSKAAELLARPVNEAITAPAIVLIDGSGKRIGLVATHVALRKAQQSQLDIVTLSPPTVNPPICRVVNYAEWLAIERAKKGLDDKVKRVKTVQIRKLIDPHDLNTKVSAMRRFLSAGHQVRVVWFEKESVEGEWVELFERVRAMLDGVGTCPDVTSKPQAVFEPIKKKKPGEQHESKKEKKKKEKEQQQAQQAQQQQQQAEVGAGAGQVIGGDGVLAPASMGESGSGVGGVKQHAKAGSE